MVEIGLQHEDAFRIVSTRSRGLESAHGSDSHAPLRRAPSSLSAERASLPSVWDCKLVKGVVGNVHYRSPI
jgi:hypothetical protein